MKVGIVTLTGGMNYGQRLQNYAMEQVLKKIGVQAETILSNSGYLLSAKQRLILIVNILLHRGNWKPNGRSISFERFNRKYVSFSNENYPNGDFQRYDKIVCGSDQIWNLNVQVIRDGFDYYFAQFVPAEKRVAFSASVGADIVPPELELEFSQAICSMQSISVRESVSVEYIRKLSGKEVQNTLDPTLLLSASEWDRIAKKPKKAPRGKYILCYFLGGTTEAQNEYIHKSAEALHLSVVNLYGDNFSNGNLDGFSYAPDEFVWLVKNCAVFLTDSFHGCAFSTIYQKPFRWFARGGTGIGMNSRIDTLFQKLRIGSWAVGNLSESTDSLLTADYTQTQEALVSEQTSAMKYIKKALNIGE